MTGRMDTFGLSDVGRVRECNEDQFLIADLKKSVVIHQTTLSYDDETHLMGGSQAQVFLVADGIGGRSAGDRASRMAIQSVVQYLLNTMHWLFRPDDDREEDFLDDLRSALNFSQNRLREAMVAPTPQSRVGSTVTMAYIVWPEVYLIHAGNSAAYLYRDHQIRCVTDDQRLPGSDNDDRLTKIGFRKFRDHEAFPMQTDHDRQSEEPAVTRFRLALHDKLLLCTDGLTRHLGEPEILDHLSRDLSAEDTCRRLIRSANDAGGEDNATVVLARFTDEFSSGDRAKSEELPDEASDEESSGEAMATIPSSAGEF